MARSRRSVAALAALCAALVASAAPAAALRTLHVDALSMRADRTRVHVGETFHLAIHARVRENVAALDELVIPDVGTMQIEGDERHVSSAPGGTDVVETLTLEPTQAGPYAFPAAYLDAIDARTGKPSRFSANPVRVVVEPAGSVLAPAADLVRTVRDAVFATIVLAALAVAIVALAMIRRSRRPRVAPPQVVPAPVPAPRTPRDAVRDALATYRVTPSLDVLIPLRAALFAAAGVPAGATLRDALAAADGPALRAALGAAERAAFGPASVRDAAAQQLIAATEEWLR